MDLEIRAITEAEWPAFLRTDTAAFGHVLSDEDVATTIRPWDLDRSVAAFDRGQIVGTAASYPFELTLPGLTTVPTAGVTWVGVLPTWRRRGVLTAMMHHQLQEVRGRGEPVAVLLASEGPIYGRFGYGLATTQADYTVERGRAVLARPFAPAGRVVLADPATAAKALPEIHDRARRLQPGEVRRPDLWWERFFKADAPRDGAGGRFHVLHESGSGELDGFASYRVLQGGTFGPPGNNTVVVQLLTAASTGAYTALWRYVCDLDLSVRVQVVNRQLDEPLRWMLTDPRALDGRVIDHLWARLVDVPAALAARRYTVPATVVVEVVDPICPWNEGRWRLEGGPDGAACTPAAEGPDLVLGAADLGAAFLGGTRLASLGRAGRVDELRPGALARADLMFASEPAPWCQTQF